jgi:hypothetical protein
MKKVLIVGSKGNMGKRYEAVCKLLGITTIGQDLKEPQPDMTGVDGIIVATPTTSHTKDIINYSRFDLPYLVEKPLTKLPIELDNFLMVVQRLGLNLQMVNQYQELVKPGAVGDTRYNYFKTGNDGLAWDCINIIGLANDSVTLNNDSPIWECVINGQKLSLSDMDRAYISMVEKWTNNPTPNLDYIRSAHDKVFKYIRKANKRCTT